MFYEEIEVKSRVSVISSGYYFSMMLLENGVVIGMGQDNGEEHIPLKNQLRIISCPKMKTISCGLKIFFFFFTFF